MQKAREINILHLVENFAKRLAREAGIGGEESCALGGPLSPGEGARDRALLCAQEPGVDPPKVKVVRHTVHFLLFIVKRQYLHCSTCALHFCR